MKCVYPNAIMLTKEQTENIMGMFDAVEKAIQKIAEAVIEWFRSIWQSEGFQHLLRWLKDNDPVPAVKSKPKWPRNMYLAPKMPILDRRPHMHVIRNNC